ncbi:hypothetical protein DZD52_09560 [Xanthomonas nasturtii]|uniref:Uncharacterized protein n=1 Tax=Xanthomonas nasturtii TaxID=1843581 RepID=A0A3E1KL84_9XANT|nr:hypothetical protein DZD52_09560 [Xanthomonas nasturtii]
MERPCRKRGPGRGAGLGVRVRGEAPVCSNANSASPVPSSGAARHLLPMGEGCPQHVPLN